MPALVGCWSPRAPALLDARPLGLPNRQSDLSDRPMIKDGDLAGLLKILQGIGVERVELCSAFGYAEFAPLLNGSRVRKILADTA